MPKALANFQSAGNIGAENTRIKLNDGDVGPPADLGHDEIQPTQTAIALAPVPAERFDLKSPVLSDAEFKAHVEALAQEIEHLERTAIFKIALHLAKAHELFRYRRDEGGFEGWVERRLGYSRSKAYDLLNVAKLMESVQCLDTLGTLPVTALYQIAASSTPEQARKDILDRAKAGEHFTCNAVAEFIAKARIVNCIAIHKPPVSADTNLWIPVALRRGQLSIPGADDPKTISAQQVAGDAATTPAPAVVEPAPESMEEGKDSHEPIASREPPSPPTANEVANPDMKRVSRPTASPAKTGSKTGSKTGKSSGRSQAKHTPSDSGEGSPLALDDAGKTDSAVGKTVENDAASSSEHRKTENAAIWHQATPEQRQFIGEKVLANFFTTVDGGEIYARIPTITTAKHREVCRAFLDALSVNGMLGAMSSEFGQELRARVPSPESKLWNKDASAVALAIEAELGAVKAAAIGKKLSKLATPNAKPPGQPFNSTKPRSTR